MVSRTVSFPPKPKSYTPNSEPPNPKPVTLRQVGPAVGRRCGPASIGSFRGGALPPGVEKPLGMVKVGLGIGVWGVG